MLHVYVFIVKIEGRARPFLPINRAVTLKTALISKRGRDRQNGDGRGLDRTSRVGFSSFCGRDQLSHQADGGVFSPHFEENNSIRKHYVVH